MTSDHTPVVELAKMLIHCPSITPITAGVFDIIEAFLIPHRFVSKRQTFREEGFDTVENIYLRYGNKGPNFCFAGHTDVVPPGDVQQWTVAPFTPMVIDGELIGRGAEDMKGAIAAFMVAAKQFTKTHPNFPGSISLLITQDEEGFAVNGTRKMLSWLEEQGEKLDHCLVGEPTNPDHLGEMVKIGRRGSVSFHITVKGVQGHVAYPERADNPVTKLVAMLHHLKTTLIDSGNEFFQPSNLEISSVDVGNPTYNVIPASASARLNVRFNDLHTSKSVEQWLRKELAPFGDYEMTVRVTGESFRNHDERLSNVVVAAVKEVTGQTPVLSTTGGTSDARFIKDYCPVIEFGATGRTAHMVNERVRIETLEGLVKVYERILEKYFGA